jgi:release factor glutamine methyltransferase
MTTQEALKISTLPVTEASILLAYVLQRDRSYLIAHPEQKLTCAQKRRFETLAKRLENHEPLAYVTGREEFYGMGFKVDKRVMIPRPETENLVTEVIQTAEKIKNPVIVDVGTGSGCIAVTLAKYLPKATLLATDVSSEALEVARINAARFKVSKKITFLCGNLLEPLREIKGERSLDIIAANLPYVKKDWYPKLDPQIFHEPKLALIGGETGLEIYQQLFIQAEKYLKPGGKVIYELDGQILIH